MNAKSVNEVKNTNLKKKKRKSILNTEKSLSNKKILAIIRCVELFHKYSCGQRWTIKAYVQFLWC